MIFVLALNICQLFFVFNYTSFSCCKLHFILVYRFIHFIHIHFIHSFSCKKTTRTNKDYSNVSTHVASTKDSDIKSKKYNQGIPKNIYVQLPSDDNVEKDTTDDSNPYEQIITKSTVLSVLSEDQESIEDRTDDEIMDGDDDAEVVWKLHVSESIDPKTSRSEIETEV